MFDDRASVYLSNTEDCEATTNSCPSMFDTSKKRKVSSNSKVDVWSHKSAKENGICVWKENTYQLGPCYRFQPSKAKEIAEQVVSDFIPKGTLYSADWARRATLGISDQVQKRLKMQRHDRQEILKYDAPKKQNKNK
ncbi:hypothetical protein PoB_002495600 [Plakobranchus ocellatus]|uniref:Uncharacterized protein n=1 Tax=Plakobranchus ocellatus TaxID=259542 RepID=A0AAV3ZH12_9GAST|nr:hypothetical protein PoB_002495600 [Plakobranchus ocellatus]